MTENPGTTRLLKVTHTAPTQPTRGTGPLDFLVPWVVELRIVGTASVIQLKLKESMVIGRGGKSDKPPDIDLEPYNGYHLGVSRRHAAVSALNSRVAIRDLNSSNGTFLNGFKLEPGRDYQLRHGDHLSFGQLDLQVSFVVTPSSHEKNETSYKDISIPVIGAGRQVLIVDDDMQVAQALGAILQEAGFQIAIVGTVTNAMSYLHQAKADAVIAELFLPDRTGIELISFIRDMNATLPIMVMGSGGFQMTQALEAGADVALSKPVGVDELINGFSQILSQMRT